MLRLGSNSGQKERGLAPLVSMICLSVVVTMANGANHFVGTVSGLNSGNHVAKVAAWMVGDNYLGRSATIIVAGGSEERT